MDAGGLSELRGESEVDYEVVPPLAGGGLSTRGGRPLAPRGGRVGRMLPPLSLRPWAPSRSRSLKAIPMAFDGKYCHHSVTSVFNAGQIVTQS